MTEPQHHYRFPKQLRLLKGSEFERVFAARNWAVSHWLTLHGTTNELGHARLGIAVSRRVGNAVVRNRWRRLLREAFRLTQHQLPAIDFIGVVRTSEPPSLQVLIDTLVQSAHKIDRRLRSSKRPTERERGS